MLRTFHAIKSVKAHATLPQSESERDDDAFVQRGYITALW